MPGGSIAAPLASPWVGIEESQARLLSAVTGVGQGESVQLGLEITLAPGFKTYWRAGGSGGPPPSVDWDGSANVALATLRWPTPKWHEVYGFDTIGYEDHIVFPIEIRPLEPGEPIGVTASVQWVACAEICIPVVEELSLTIPAGPAVPSDDAALIESFAERVPGDGNDHGLTILSTALSGSPKEPLLQVTVGATGKPLTSPEMFVEGGEDILFSRPKMRLVADGWRAVFRTRAEDVWGDLRPLDLTAEPLVVTVVDGERSMEAELSPTR